MNCPVCDRSLAPTLSICPSCGAMMYDTVREELQTKVIPAVSLRSEVKPPSREPVKLAPPAIVASPPIRRPQTGRLAAAAKTSLTVVDFQPKSAPLPEWRLELQRSVQQRRGVTSINTDAAAASVSALLRAEVVERREAAPKTEIADPRVAAAMRRIDESRKTFRGTVPKAAKTRPFEVVSPRPNPAAAAAAAPAKIALPSKPITVEATPVIQKRDTNKLPPIETVAPSLFESQPEPAIEKPIDLPIEAAEIKRIHIKADAEAVEYLAPVAGYDEEIEDLAPFSMRFGAGLFDLIIGAFASMLLLSPIAFTTVDWWTAAGGLIFAGVFAAFMFIYMTASLGFTGKTLGMRLFSLELVDAVENEYPTISQAAVNSSIFLLSLPFAGIGFATVFFNEENRALHDLLSGTIIVKEF